MVIIDKMEKAMDQETFQFLVKVLIVFGCLSTGFMEIDDDVTQYKF